jgi:alkyldihydroxyacetonephosphate synthase
VPVPAARRFGAWKFATVEDAWEAMRALLQAELHPAVLRLYDPVDTRIAGKGTATPSTGGSRWLGELRAAAESIPALRKHLLSLPLAIPRLVNGILQGIAGGCVLIVGWEGVPETVEVLARHGAALLAKGEAMGEGPGEHWYAHRHEVSYKLAPIFERGGFADTMEVASTWARLPALYAGVREALGRHTLVMAHFSHVYREGCSIYFSFAGVGRLEVYDATWRDALAAAAAAGGTVAHHHGVGQLKAVAAAREMAGIAPLYRALKARLDPAGILNPGRMFPAIDAPEPDAPALGIDAVSQIATLAAQEPAAVRDAALAAAGWALRNPTAEPLASAVRAPKAPWETPVLGASARLSTGRAVLVPVPRSAAGPDPRACLPVDRYETLTVPVVRLDEPAFVVAADFDRCVAADLRPARRVDGGVEFRGPAAAELVARVRALGLAAVPGSEAS